MIAFTKTISAHRLCGCLKNVDEKYDIMYTNLDSSSKCFCFCYIQGSQSHLNQPSAPALPLDLLKSASTPALVTDNNGNHFLIALTSHITENQSTDAPESKATNELPLQVRNSYTSSQRSIARTNKQTNKQKIVHSKVSQLPVWVQTSVYCHCFEPLAGLKDY